MAHIGSLADHAQVSPRRAERRPEGCSVLCEKRACEVLQRTRRELLTRMSIKPQRVDVDFCLREDMAPAEREKRSRAVYADLEVEDGKLDLGDGGDLVERVWRRHCVLCSRCCCGYCGRV